MEKNHLLRNLFFYASAVNVHIVAVWCSVKKNNDLVCSGGGCWGAQWKEPGLPEILHQYISYFTERKLLDFAGSHDDGAQAIG